MNHVTIQGNLTREPELRSAASGAAILSFSVAFNDRVKDKTTGEWTERPNYVDVTVFGNYANTLSSMLTKGTRVVVDGRLRWDSWEKDGQKRSKIQVIANEIVVVPRFNATGDAPEATIPEPVEADDFSLASSDIPF